MVQMGFVLSRSRRSPSIEDILIALHQFGLTATPDAQQSGDTYGFDLHSEGSLVVAFVDAPHPDIDAIDFTTQWVGTELGPTASHLPIILHGSTNTRPGGSDRALLSAAAAVADATDAVAARIGLGLNYFAIDDFTASLRELDGDAVVPSRFSVGCDIALPNEEQVSILSNGLVQYGREDFLLLAPQDKKDFALSLLWELADHARANEGHQDVLAAIAQSVDGLLQPPKRIPSPTKDDQQVIQVVLAT